MGLRGPKPAPTAIKLAKGERRPSRTNHEEPEIPAAAAETAPEGLHGAGLGEWKRVGDLLKTAGVLRETDTAALEDYCRGLTELRRFELKAKKAGPELAIAKGYQGMVVKLRAQVTQLRRELGLTPSSRSGIRVAKADGPKKDDVKERYLRALPGGRA